MRKYLLVLVLVAALAILAVGVSANGGATVIEGGLCSLASADWGGPETLFTTDMHAVETPSGNVKLTCHFDIPSDLLAVITAERQRGFSCGTPFGNTDDSWSVTSPDDEEALLRCQIKH
jgi:hypothetical protein